MRPVPHRPRSSAAREAGALRRLLSALLAVVMVAVGLAASSAAADAVGFGGTFRDVAGAPIAGLRVVVSGQAADGDWWYHSTETDADGRFAVRVGETVSEYDGAFRPGTYQVFTDGGWDTPTAAFETWSETSVVVTDSFENFDVTLRRLPAASGVVTDEDGFPAAVDVAMFDAEGSIVTSTYTAPGGSYLLAADLPSGPARIGFATASGSSLYVPQYFDAATTLSNATPLTLAYEATRGDVDAVLSRGASVSGTVTRPDGGERGNLRVAVFNDDAPGLVTRVGWTNDDGSFTVYGLLPGTYRVAVTQPIPYVPGLGESIEWFYGTGRTSPTQPNVVVPPDGTVTGVDVSVGTTATATVTPDESDPARGTVQLDNTRGTSTAVYTVSVEEAETQYAVPAGTTIEVPFGRLPGGAVVLVSVDGGPITGYQAPRSFMAGTVTDSSGTPLEDVRVEVRALGLRGDQAITTTSEDGQWSISWLEPGNYTVRFLPDEMPAQYFPGVVDRADAEVVTLSGEEATYISGIDAVIGEGASISGAVTDAAGEVPAGAVVRLYTAEDLYDPVREIPLAPDGTYEFRGLLANNYAVQVGTGTGFAIPRWLGETGTRDDATAIALGATDQVTDADLVVELGGVLTGTIRALRENSLSVGIYDADGNEVSEVWAWGDVLVWRSDALPAGDYRVRLDNGAITTWWEDASTKEAATPVTVVPGTEVGGLDHSTTTAGSLSGVLTAADTGEPLRDAWVTAYRVVRTEDRAFPVYVASTAPSEDGRWVIGGLPAAEYVVDFTAFRDGVQLPQQWYGTGWSSDLAQPGIILSQDEVRTGLDHEFDPGVIVSGSLVDATTGAPLSGDVTLSVSDEGWDGQSYDYAGPDGKFRMAVRAGGEYLLTARAPGRLEVSRVVDVPAGGLTGLEVELEVAATVTGRVRAENNGVPLSRVSVDIMGADGQWVSSDSTDDDGFYTSPGLPSGDYVVRFNNWSGLYVSEYYDDVKELEDAQVVTLTDSPVTVDASLTLGGAVRGVARDAEGAPLAGATVGLAREVVARAALAPGTDPVAPAAVGEILSYATTTTAADGSYELPPVDPGTYRLYVYRPDLGTTWYDGQRTFTTADPVVVGANRTVEVDPAVRPLVAGEEPRTPEGSLTDVFSIVRQPSDVTVAVDELVMLRAAAAGDPAPTVQWQVRVPGGTWTDIEGAVDGELVLGPAEATQHGNRYRAVFTQGDATLTTREALVSVSLPATPPAAPAAPTTSAVGRAEATVTWAEPDDSGASIDGYRVAVYEGTASQPTTTLEVGLTTSTPLTALTAGTAYRVAVAAHNAKGWGSWSPEASFTTLPPLTVPGAPGNPVATGTTETSVSLTWSAPVADGGTPVTGYTVKAYTEGATAPSATVSPTGTTTTVSGLVAGTTYTFEVAAQNTVGAGPASARSLPVTTGESTVPVAPYGQVLESPDLTGDRRADVVVVDAVGRMQVYPGRGDGTLGAPRAGTTGWKSSRLFALGDWDGDGRSDLASADSAGRLYLLAGDGAGGFAAPRQVGRGWSAFRIVPAGDVNGDRSRDMLAIDASGVLWLYPGVGDGSFGRRVQLGRGWGGVQLYAAGDSNRDGRVDILSIDGRGRLYFYPGTGGGYFGRAQQVGRGWGGFVFASGADMNGDGINDLLGRDKSGRLWFYAGRGSGTFAAAVQVAQGW